MALTDFFRINMPYGAIRNLKNEWFVFNREYMPLGWNNSENKGKTFDSDFKTDLPIFTAYKGLTDVAIKKIIINPVAIQYNEDTDKIKMFFLYNDATNPMNDKSGWDAYFNKIKALSKFDTKKAEY